MANALPPVQAQDWQAHESTRFREQADATSAPFEQQQEAEAQASQIVQARQAEESAQIAARDQQATAFRAQADQIAGGFEQDDRARQAAAFRTQADTLTAPLEQELTATPATRDQYAGGQASISRADGSAPGGELQDYARAAATRAGIDPETFVRQIQQESGFNPDARNPSGATGIAQIVPSAHPGVDPTDPRASLDYAANWMGQLTKSYGGDKAKALAAYNAGPGNVEKYGGIPPFEETQRYVRTILGDQTGDALGAETPAPGGRNAELAPQTSTGRGSRVEAVGQFEQGLPYEEAAAICGPVAALALIQQHGGRNPSLAEVTAAARRHGWTAEGGMNGIANEKALLDEYGVANRLDLNPDFGHIAEDAANGNPVIISTPIHYWYVSDYDKTTGQLYVGKTGTSRRGGGSWMTPQQIATLDGGINGALFVDNPQSPTPSVGAQEPAPDEGGAVGGSFADEQATVRVPGTGLDQPASPDLLGAAGTALDAGGDLLVGQVERNNAEYQAWADASRAIIEKRQRGEPVSQEEYGRAVELSAPFALAMTGEPLNASGAAGKVAGQVGEAGAEIIGTRLPVWMRPLEEGRAPDLSPVAGSRPGSMLGEAPASAARPTTRTPTGFGEPRAPVPTESDLAPLDRALARPVEPAAARLKDGADRLIREAYDRNYPLRELDDLAGNAPNQGAHAAAQVTSGAVAAGEDNVRRVVMPVLKGLGPDAAELERYWILKASEDVVARYPHARLPGGIDGPGGVVRGIAAMKRELGPERFGKIDDALTSLTQANVDLRLKPLLDEGLISPQQFTDLKNSNPHYLPFQRYEYATDGPGHLLPGGGAGLGPSSTGIKARTAGGSNLALDKPVARWMADMINVQQVVSRNRAARAIVEGLQKAEEATGQKMVVVAEQGPMAAAGGTRTTQERGVIRFFDPAEPGVQKVANVPDIYATVAKGLEAEPANLFMRLASAAAMPLRAGATTLSLSFLPRNIARDFQSAYVKEGIKAWSPEMIAGWKAAIAKNADFSEAARAGALQSGLLESRRTDDAFKRAQQLRGITVQSPQDAVLLLPRLLGKAVSPVMRLNEIAEQAPRLATFIKARGEGAGALESAVRARDVTIDFSKSGNFVRMMNQMVPFLNARVQGAANTVRLFQTNPVQASARVVAPSAFLSTAAYLWNQRYDSAKSIPDYEWDRNWIFVMGEGRQNPDPRQPDATPEAFPIYARIPKGDAASIATAPIELMLRLAFQQGDRSVVEHVIQAASAATRGLSPIDPTGSGLMSLVSPPVGTTAGSMLANYDFFRERAIVPDAEKDRPREEQYGPDTSSAAVALGQQFGVSPRMIDYAIKSYTGGAGGQALWLLDLALGGLGYDPTTPGEARLRQRTTTESVVRTPGVSGFVGAANTEQRQVGRDHFQQAVTESQRAFTRTPDARRLGVSFGPVSDAIDRVVLTPEERIAYQRRSAEIAAELVERVQSSGSYDRGDDDRKRKILQDTLEEARKRAGKEILREIPKGDQRDRKRAS